MMSDLVLDDRVNKQSVDSFIGQKLRIFRRRAGATLEEIANAVNISKQLIQKYETGMTKIPVSVLCRIADILHIKPTDFFEGYRAAHKPNDQNLYLSAEKTDTLKILLISTAIEIDYMLQSLGPQIRLVISTSNLTCMDDIDNYARQLKFGHKNFPIPDIIIYDTPSHQTQIQGFMKKIRHTPFNRETPVVILSTNPEIEAMKKAYFYGAAGYIYKNIPAPKLKKNLKHMLNYWGKACNLSGTNKVSMGEN